MSTGTIVQLVIAGVLALLVVKSWRDMNGPPDTQILPQLAMSGGLAFLFLDALIFIVRHVRWR